MSHLYDRLTGIDNSFLVYEDHAGSGAMHVASTQIHEAAPLRREDGSLDIERIEEYVESRLEAAGGLLEVQAVGRHDQGHVKIASVTC